MALKINRKPVKGVGKSPSKTRLFETCFFMRKVAFSPALYSYFEAVRHLLLLRSAVGRRAECRFRPMWEVKARGRACTSSAPRTDAMSSRVKGIQRKTAVKPHPMCRWAAIKRFGGNVPRGAATVPPYPPARASVATVRAATRLPYRRETPCNLIVKCHFCAITT